MTLIGNEARSGRCPFSAGSLHQDYSPFSSIQTDDPFPIWAMARSEQPIFYSDVLDCWIVTSYALV